MSSNTPPNDPMPASVAASVSSTKVRYTRLGRSGLRVSVPILGAMSLGSKAWAPWVEDDAAKVTALLKAAYDVGLNTWDTANMYSNGESERLIGRAVRDLGIPREKVVILTKCFGCVGDTPDATYLRFPEMLSTKDYINQWGLSRAAIFNAVDKSLERLGMDYIDLLQIHRFDSEVPIEETMEALNDLVRSGKVRYIGASSMWAWQFAEMQACAERRGWAKFVSMQNCYSLCYREEEREMIPYCHHTGVGLIPWAPLYRGDLARPLSTAPTERATTTSVVLKPRLTDVDKATVQKVDHLAQKKGWAMAQVALAWVVQKGCVPIVGFSSEGRLMEAVGVTGKELTDEEMRDLDEGYIPKVVYGHS